MKLFFDRRLGYLVAAPGQDTALTTLQAKAGDTEEIIIQFGRSSDPTSATSIITAPTWTPENLSGGTVITAALKEEGKYSDGTVLATNSTWTNDAGAYTYTGTIGLNTTAINTALERLDTVSADDIASIDCGFEITYQVGGAGGWKSSVLPVTWTLYHDIIGGAEGTPTDADDPDEYLLKAAGIEWYPTVTSLTGGTSADLDYVPTALVDVGKIVAILDTDPATDIIRIYKLTAGTTAESSPSVIRPDDYATTTNEKIWMLQSFGGTGDLLAANNLSDLASAATARTNLGLAIGTNVQAYDADLTTWAGVTPGTGIATALAVNVGSAGAPVLFNGAGGTPSALVLTNATGLPTGGILDDAVTAAKLADTAVTPGAYTSANITVDAQGRLTAAANGSGGGDLVNDTTPQLGGTLDCNSKQVRLAMSASTLTASGGTLTLVNDGNYFAVNAGGISAISALANGAVIKLHFNDAMSLSNSGNLVLPGGDDIVTANGDEAEFIQFSASPGWRCTSYVRANKQVRAWKGADVASAAALTLGADGNYFDVTGTTTVTSIVTRAIGTVVKLHFDAALTLTHHATDLILPGGANITTAASDEAEFVEYATGDWRCTSYTKASGLAVVGGSGKLVNAWFAESTSVFSTATAIPIDDTIPQNTEGAEILTKAITPSSTGNYLKFTVTGWGTVSVAGWLMAAIFKDADASATFAQPNYVPLANGAFPIAMTCLVPVASTSSQTWKLRAGPNSGTAYINQAASGGYLSTSDKVTLLIEEITLT